MHEHYMRHRTICARLSIVPGPSCATFLCLAPANVIPVDRLCWVGNPNCFAYYLFFYSKYCRYRLYLRPKLRFCHTLSFSTKGDILILAVSLTAFVVAVLLLETPHRLLLAQTACTPKESIGETIHFLSKVPPMFTLFFPIYALLFSYSSDFI